MHLQGRLHGNKRHFSDENYVPKWKRTPPQSMPTYCIEGCTNLDKSVTFSAVLGNSLQQAIGGAIKIPNNIDFKLCKYHYQIWYKRVSIPEYLVLLVACNQHVAQFLSGTAQIHVDIPASWVCNK